MISKGDKFPSVTIKQATAEGGADVNPAELFAGKKVVMFSLPGAFTPTCSQKHLPGYLEKLPELKAAGIELDLTGRGLGLRCNRGVMTIDNGVVTSIDMEEPGKLEVSTADACLLS